MEESMLRESTVVSRPTLAHAGQGRVVDAYGSEVLFKLGAAETGGRLTLGLAVVPPGNGPPPHVHRAEDELFIIVEGRYEVLTEGRWTEVGPGAVVYLPRGCVHTFRNVGDSAGRHWVLTTSGEFERFYERSAAVFAEPGAPDLARLLEIAREHDLEFV
jgi:quercetin dioxygenase-like cupin family protein